MENLEGINVAILATDMVEESELTQPRQALRDAGATTELISPNGPEIIAASHFDKSNAHRVDRRLHEVSGADYDALLLPGGALNADQLRADPKVQEFVKHFDEAGKPIAVICHGPWLLVSAGLVKGRTLTSYHSIADDIRNAGGSWVDEKVIRDNNWVSSRKPADLSDFNREMLKLFAEFRQPQFQSRPLAEPVFREQLDDLS